MKREKLMEAGINYDEGVARFAGKSESYEKYLRRLFDANPLETLMRQLDDGDTAAAFKTAHDLKGNAGSLSVTALYEAVSQLVELLRAGEAPREDYMRAAYKAKECYGRAERAAQEAEHDS